MKIKCTLKSVFNHMLPSSDWSSSSWAIFSMFRLKVSHLKASVTGMSPGRTTNMQAVSEKTPC